MNNENFQIPESEYNALKESISTVVNKIKMFLEMKEDLTGEELLSMVQKEVSKISPETLPVDDREDVCELVMTLVLQE